MSTRVLLAFGLRAVREVLTLALDRSPGIQVVGQADDTASVVRLARELRPDLVLLDDFLPDFSDIDPLATLSVEYPTMRLVALVKDRASARQVPAGATAALAKDTPLDELVAAIKLAMSKQPTKARSKRGAATPASGGQPLVRGI